MSLLFSLPLSSQIHSRRCKGAAGTIDGGLNINEISSFVHRFLLPRRGVTFTKSLLFVLHKLLACKRVVKYNECGSRHEIFYTALDSNHARPEESEDMQGDDDWPVDCYGINDKFLITFRSIQEAADALGPIDSDLT